MTLALQAVRGMNDLLPQDNRLWHHVERVIRETVLQYGYSEIRCPIVEQTELFVRSVGESTDIVEKEMYTFADRNGDSLSLRPEGTAGSVRAAIEHGLLYNQTQRLWYMGQMFRHERPQRGRYRQFYQFGVEAFGWEGPDIDAEILAINARVLARIGVAEHGTLQINSLGSFEVRAQYREILRNYFSRYENDLDEDSKRRLHNNPLRILDSKNPALKEMIETAPTLLEVLDAPSRDYFDKLCGYLKNLNIQFVINPRLVRGLDYYCHMVFEWITDKLGAQSAICSGGRYDGLVEQLGGSKVPAVGFGLGIDRVINLLEAIEYQNEALLLPDAYLLTMGELAQQQGLMIAEKLREQLPGFRLVMQCGETSFKTQMKKADKSGAWLALILGEEEMSKHSVTIKLLREEVPQQMVTINQLTEFLSSLMKELRA